MRAAHVYGEVRVWAEDAPRRSTTPMAASREHQPARAEPARPHLRHGRSRSPSSSRSPRSSTVQSPARLRQPLLALRGAVHHASAAPPSPAPLLCQNCPDRMTARPDGPAGDAAGDGHGPLRLLRHRLTACRVREDVSSAAPGPRARARAASCPGRFGSMFVYNYSLPRGPGPGRPALDALRLRPGVHLHHAAHLPLVDRARARAPAAAEQWNKYLDLTPPVEINLRHCGLRQRARAVRHRHAVRPQPHAT